MRKSFLYLSLVLILASIIQNVSAISYRSYIELDVNPQTANTSLNIKSAQLLEKYVKKIKNSLESLKKKYDIINDKKINSALQTLANMSYSLDRIQTKNIEKDDVDEIMKDIVKDLKIINTAIKPLLKEKKEIYEKEFEAKKIAYTKLGKRLGENLDKIIKRIAAPLRNRKNLSKQEKVLANYIKSLVVESEKLKNLDDVDYSSKQEMKSSLIRILKRVQSDIRGIKSIKY